MLARFDFDESLRPDAAAAVAALRARGLEVVLLSGDRPERAARMGQRLEVSAVIGGATPERKLAEVAAAQAQGLCVAMVGDGINDAPALAAADLGIAMGTGTDIAIEAGDVTLMRGDPRGIARTIALAHAAMRVMRQNLWWAFGFNVLMIPLAAGVFVPLTGWRLSPMLASAAMALSSVSVIANSLRLRRAVEDSWPPQ